MHITSSSPTHLNPQKQRKPASDPSERQTISTSMHWTTNRLHPEDVKAFSRYQGTSHGHLIQTSSVENRSKLNKYNGRRVKLFAKRGSPVHRSENCQNPPFTNTNTYHPPQAHSRTALTDADAYTRTNRLTNAETRDTDMLTHLPQR